jgi:GTPase SAR1 family protein
VPDYEELRAAALDLFGQSARAARRAGAEETLHRLRAGEDRLAGAVLTVVVCGEFSRGKSTLINALLDQKEGDELLPTGISYTTSHITTISHGDRERISVELQDGSVAGISRAQLRQYVTQDGNPGNDKHVIAAAIELPADLLAPGITLVDTPGIGGVYMAHTLVTSEALTIANAIIFVADAVQPVTASEIRFLSRALEATGASGDANALICVLTKIDLVDDPDEIVVSTQAKLVRATGWPQVRVVGVSSQAKLAYLDSDDEADLADSNFPELRRVLWDALNRRRARAVLASAVQDIDAAAVAMLEPVDAELGMLRVSGPGAADKVRAVYEERRQNLEGLGVAAASWRGDLLRDVAAMGSDVVRGAQDNAARAWQNVPGYLDDNKLLADPERLFQRIDEDLSVITSIADRLLYAQAARIQRNLAEQLGLAPWPVEISRLPPAPVPALRESLEEGGRRRAQGRDNGQPASRIKALRSSSAVSVGATVGSVLGRLVEMFVAPGAGTVIGGTLGATAGLLVSGAARLARWRNPDDAVRKLSRGEMRRQLHADLDAYYEQALLPHLSSHVAQVADEWRIAITAETDSRIRQKQASLAEAASRISAPVPDDAERTAAREADLTAQRESLLGIRRHAVQLAVAAAGLAAAGGHDQDGRGEPALDEPAGQDEPGRRDGDR